jgi:hypothetical protein
MWGTHLKLVWGKHDERVPECNVQWARSQPTGHLKVKERTHVCVVAVVVVVVVVVVMVGTVLCARWQLVCRQ